MTAFLEWLNGPPETSEVLRAALAHLWFVTIHPFDDGNGRIARAIADMRLARADNTPQRYYSMSAQIHAERASTTGCWSRPRGLAPMSPRGCHGSLAAWNAPSATPLHPLTSSWTRKGPGKALPTLPSTIDKPHSSRNRNGWFA